MPNLKPATKVAYYDVNAARELAQNPENAALGRWRRQSNAAAYPQRERTQQPQEPSACVHWYVFGSPVDGVEVGVCKYCQAIQRVEKDDRGRPAFPIGKGGGYNRKTARA